MGNWKFWAAIAFLAGFGYAWYTGLVQGWIDQVANGVQPSTTKVQME